MMETTSQHASATSANTNGVAGPLADEDDELYTQLLQLRDLVVLGQHPQFKLPPAIVEQLRASPGSHRTAGYKPNEVAVANLQSCPDAPSVFSNISPLPGLQSSITPLNGGKIVGSNEAAPQSKPSVHTVALPEKPVHPMVEDTKAKRARIEAELSHQSSQGERMEPYIDVDQALARALGKTMHVSALTTAKEADKASVSSFDENDYYSSHFETDWSSDDSSLQNSDPATAPQIANGNTDESHTESLQLPAQLQQRVHSVPVSPPALARSPPVFAQVRKDNEATGNFSVSDDSSDYEPGDIIIDNIDFAPQGGVSNIAANRDVPVYRNNLTHIEAPAPQPGRRSMLTTARERDFEQSLKNTQPEVTSNSEEPSKYRPIPQRADNRPQFPTRASSPSPPGSGDKRNGRKARKNKRKAPAETPRRPKKHKSRADFNNENYSPPPVAPDPPMYTSDEQQSSKPHHSHARSNVPQDHRKPDTRGKDYQTPYMRQDEYRLRDSRIDNQRPSDIRQDYGYPPEHVDHVVERDAYRRPPNNSLNTEQPSSRHPLRSPVAPYRIDGLYDKGPETSQRVMSNQNRRQPYGEPDFYMPEHYPDSYQNHVTYPGQSFVIDQHGNKYYHVGAVPNPQASLAGRSILNPETPPIRSRSEDSYERDPGRLRTVPSQREQDRTWREPTEYPLASTLSGNEHVYRSEYRDEDDLRRRRVISPRPAPARHQEGFSSQNYPRPPTAAMQSMPPPTLAPNAYREPVYSREGVFRGWYPVPPEHPPVPGHMGSDMPPARSNSPAPSDTRFRYEKPSAFHARMARPPQDDQTAQYATPVVSASRMTYSRMERPSEASMYTRMIPATPGMPYGSHSRRTSSYDYQGLPGYVQQGHPGPQVMRASSVMPRAEVERPLQPIPTMQSYPTPQPPRYYDQNGNQVWPSRVTQSYW